MFLQTRIFINLIRKSKLKLWKLSKNLVRSLNVTPSNMRRTSDILYSFVYVTYYAHFMRFCDSKFPINV